MTDYPKGGQQARRAAMLCQNPRFRLYLDARLRWETGMTLQALPDGTASDLDAAEFIRARCGVRSRAELDHVAEARNMLDRIVSDYQRWERAQRRAG